MSVHKGLRASGEIQKGLRVSEPPAAISRLLKMTSWLEGASGGSFALSRPHWGWNSAMSRSCAESAGRRTLATAEMTFP